MRAKSLMGAVQGQTPVRIAGTTLQKGGLCRMEAPAAMPNPENRVVQRIPKQIRLVARIWDPEAAWADSEA